MSAEKVVIIGAGIGGLVAALELAARGLDVTVVEQASAPGGKMRQVAVAGASIDAGPTVFTMRWIFEEIFARVGASLDAHVTLRRAEVLARHHWSAAERLDLFADIDRSADAIGRFAGPAEAVRYRQFCDRARRVFQSLDGPFIRAQRSDPIGLARNAGAGGMAGLWSGAPFSTLWRELGRHFHDPRLRQLFGRYATYCGSSPFEAPATLMLIAHVEQCGVWLVDGGMHRIAVALEQAARTRGAMFRYETSAAEILVRSGRAVGVALAGGERIAADAVVHNGDVAALAGGLMGPAATAAVAGDRSARRSLSAVTWAMVADAGDFPLIRHNVFFSDAYEREFEEIFRRAAAPSMPTVYVCAQDRADGDKCMQAPERLFCLMNAPAVGDSRAFDRSEVRQCETRAFAVLERCGFRIDPAPDSTVVTTPRDFDRMYPATGGALYGRATHGWQASFRRPGARTRIEGLYLAGGSVHPGAGAPMAALSGHLAAETLLADLASTRSSGRTGMRGGTSTRSAPMGIMV